MSLAGKLPLSVGLLTDVGRQRAGSINQDAAVALDLPTGGLYAIADGMGGHAAGELAANLALDTLTQHYLETKGLVPERLTEAVQAANVAVTQQAVGEAVGMGTTLLAIVVDRGAAIVAHVGDSRAYLLRGGQLVQLTEDHSWVAEQVRQGFLTEEEGQNHQWKNVVNNALGGEERVRLDLFGLSLQAGDRLLLCSDGLSGPLGSGELQAILSRSEPPDAVTRLLIDAANDAGGPDNITALVLDIPAGLGTPRYALPERLASGPEYADVLLSTRRGSSLMTYALLTTLYFTVLGMMLFPGRSRIIAAAGVAFIAGLLLWQRLSRQQTKNVWSVSGLKPRGSRAFEKRMK